MISLTEVKNGSVTLADIARVNCYLDAKQDIEWAAHKDAEKKMRR